MTDTELSSGITSLSEALALSIGLLDGDITTTTADIPNDDEGKSSNEDTKLSPPSNNKQTPIERAISILTKLQTQISHNNLISSNEILNDISTSTIELLCVDYQLGRAFLLLPTYFPQSPSVDGNEVESNGRNGSSSSMNNSTASPSKLRKHNVTRAMEYYHSYLKRLEQLSECENNNKDDTLLSSDTIKEYHTYLDMDDMNSDRGTEEEGDDNSREATLVMNPSQIREMKIQRYKRKKALTTQTQLLQSKLQQRTRLNISQEETFDNHNYESLIRTLYIEQLKLYAEESIDELYSSRNELEMLDMSIKMEESRMNGDGRMNRMSSHAASAALMSLSSNNTTNGPQGGNQPQQQPMAMTQITQNPLTGELEYTKQELSNGQLKSTSTPQSSHQILPHRQNIKESIFKPSWNLPTMSLSELGDKERAEAIQRSRQQKIAEEQSIYKPKRYDQLVKDGMEDNEELVEASAKLDREWDDWKEENPRGSGNKMSERGDRNF